MRLLAAVYDLDLERVWEMRPQLDGRALKEKLKDLPEGKGFGEVMSEQVNWMLAHPKGREEDLLVHLQGFIYTLQQ